MKLTIDFETRSSGVDLRKSNAQVYAADPGCEAMCLAVKVDDGPTRIWAPSTFMEAARRGGIDTFQDPLPEITLPEIYDRFQAADEIEAHNVGFERAVWKHQMRAKWSAPEVPTNKWRCSAAAAAKSSLPRALGSACSVLELPIQKNEGGRALMLKMCKPRKARKHEPDGIYWWESDQQMYELFAYCIQDVDSEHCLAKAVEPLSESELAIWRADQLVNERGVYCDIEGVQAIIDMAEYQAVGLREEFERLTGGLRTTQGEKLKVLLAEQGVVMNSLAADRVEHALKKATVTGKPRRILELRQQLAKTSVAKYAKMQLTASADNRIRGCYRYHGAHTGRWSGKDVQMQNVPRGTFKDYELFIQLAKAREFEDAYFLFGDLVQAAVTCIRPMLCAEEGNTLLCQDYKSIEGRILAWVAGETEVIDMYVAGRDLYKVAATYIYGCLYEEVTDKQRQIGKVAELALGYQGSVGAFQQMAVGYGVVVADAEVKNIVSAWRSRRKKTAQFWKNVNDAAMMAIRNTNKAFCVNGIYFAKSKNNLRITLPSGRQLRYWNPVIETVKKKYGDREYETEQICYWGVCSKTSQWRDLETYGGKLTENIVQAIGRDLQADALVNAEAAGYPVVMHTHDELAAEVKIGGDQTLAGLGEIMSNTPAWAAGVPVETDGWEGKRYRK